MKSMVPGLTALPRHSAVSLRLTVKKPRDGRGYASIEGGAASIQKQDRYGEASLTALCCGKAAARRDTVSFSTTWGWKADILLRAKPNRVSASLRPGVSVSAPRFVTISSEHFRVTYPADLARREADQVLNILESTRSDLLRRASAASIPAFLPTLEIRFNESTGDFVGRSGQPWWAAAATKGNRIEMQPLPILRRRGVLTTTLRHELAHVIINIISRDRAPRWLEEGFAIYLAGEGSMFSNYVQGGLLVTDELEKRLAHPRTQQEMRGLYAQAYLNVNQLIRSGGEGRVWKKVAES